LAPKFENGALIERHSDGVSFELCLCGWTWK
jgi:hypothetical protein